MLTLTTIFDWLGTFAFAVSGIRLASAKDFDWFGALIVGLITAIGGGTLRDLILDLPVFWLAQPHYIIITILALLFTIVFKKYLVTLENGFFIFDTVGIAVFTVIGIDKALCLLMPLWVAVIMGVITATAGGVMRDVLIKEHPLIFRQEIYATACFIGGGVYCALLSTVLPVYISQIIAMLLIIIIRCVSVKYKLKLSKINN